MFAILTNIFVCLYFSPDLNGKVAPWLEPYVDIFGRAPIRFVVRTKKQQGRTNRSLTFDILNIQFRKFRPQPNVCSFGISFRCVLHEWKRNKYQESGSVFLKVSDLFMN